MTRFGLTYVDYDTQKRYPKESGKFVAQVRYMVSYGAWRPGIDYILPTVVQGTCPEGNTGTEGAETAGAPAGEWQLSLRQRDVLADYRVRGAYRNCEARGERRCCANGASPRCPRIEPQHVLNCVCPCSLQPKKKKTKKAPFARFTAYISTFLGI